MLCYAALEIEHNFTMSKLLTLFIMLFTLSACIYVPPVQQGNALKQKDVNLLKPGMTKRQVVLVMGTPAISDPFHQDRWDYIFVVERKNEVKTHKHMLITFEDNKLTRIEGDYQPGGNVEDDEKY